MFGPRAFDCDVEPQLTSADSFYSIILNRAPEAGSAPPFSVYIGFHDNVGFIS